MSLADQMNRKDCEVEIVSEGKTRIEEDVPASYSKHARLFSILTPVVFFTIVSRIVIGALMEEVPNIYGSDATALLGGTAAVILILSAIADQGKNSLEKISGYLKEGKLF